MSTTPPCILPVRSRYFAALSIAAAIVAATPAVASPQPAFDTFGPNNTTGTNSPLPIFLISESSFGIFTSQSVRFTATVGGPLQSVTFALVSIGIGPTPVGQVNVVIHSDNAGIPGTILEMIQAPFVPVANEPVVVTVNSLSNPMLAAASHYWVGLQGAVNPTALGWATGLGSATGYTCSSGTGLPYNCTFRIVAPGEVRIVVDAPALPGACCRRDTTCFTMTPPQCASFAGQFLGEQTVCGVIFCPIVLPSGACCEGSVCSIRTVLTCGNIFGGPPAAYLGNGATCTPVTRRGPVNACCPADFNNSGAASVQDLFDFLATFFSGCP